MKRIVSLLAVIGTMGYAASASAIGTAADTKIDNTASATFTIDGAPLSESSGLVTFRVDEILDVDVTGGDTELVGGAAGTDDVDQVLEFTVTNTGNGTEAYDIAVNLLVAGDDFDPTSPLSGTLVYIDDGDGLFDPALDTAFDPATQDLTLLADQTAVLFVVTDMPVPLASGQTADVSLTATSTTKVDPLDPTGTLYENAGDNGVDAIVGTTTAQDTDTGTYLVNQLIIDLTKSAEKTAGTVGVLGPIANADVVQVPGDEITYTLTFTVSGDGTLDDVFITDAIPVGVNYVAGSIRYSLDGGALQSPTDDSTDTDGVFKGAIPAGNPDATKQGVVVDVENIYGVTSLVATTATTPAVNFTVVVTFKVIIPLT